MGKIHHIKIGFGSQTMSGNWLYIADATSLCTVNVMYLISFRSSFTSSWRYTTLSIITTTITTFTYTSTISSRTVASKFSSVKITSMMTTTYDCAQIQLKMAAFDSKFS